MDAEHDQRKTRGRKRKRPEKDARGRKRKRTEEDSVPASPRQTRSRASVVPAAQHDEDCVSAATLRQRRRRARIRSNPEEYERLVISYWNI